MADYVIDRYGDKRHPKRKYMTNSEKEAETMLHLAVRVENGQNYQSIANSVNIKKFVPTMADITLSALKERIRARINQNPDERWLIVSGNTIAENSAPPVAYRQW